MDRNMDASVDQHMASGAHHSAALKAQNASDLASLRRQSAAFPLKCIILPLSKTRIVVLPRCDIATVQADAIVNAANETLEGGGGVDQRIHGVAGPELRDACRLIKPVKVASVGGAIHVGEWARCPVGEARVTPGFRLPHARHIIHTVAPLLDDAGAPRPKVLRRCYESCLAAALELEGVSSVAFCSLGTGYYGFPERKAVEVALTSTACWLEARAAAEEGGRGYRLKTIFFTTHGDAASEMYPLMLGALAGMLGADVAVEASTPPSPRRSLRDVSPDAGCSCRDARR